MKDRTHTALPPWRGQLAPAQSHEFRRSDLPTYRSELSDLGSWLDQLRLPKAPRDDDLVYLHAWQASMSPNDRELVEAIGQALLVMSRSERDILYTSCSETERRILGLCLAAVESKA